MNTVKPGTETTEFAVTQSAARLAATTGWAGIALIVLGGLFEVLTQLGALGVGGQWVGVAAMVLGGILRIAGTLGLSRSAAGYAVGRGLAKVGANELGAAMPIALPDGRVVVYDPTSGMLTAATSAPANPSTAPSTK